MVVGAAGKARVLLVRHRDPAGQLTLVRQRAGRITVTAHFNAFICLIIYLCLIG